MPKEGIFRECEGKLKLKLDYDPDKYSSGSIRMRIADCMATLKEDDGREVGKVAACIGGGFQISVGKRDWFLGVLELFTLVQKLDEAYMAEGK